ncbi:sugar ABC transporter substrate-binding protein [Hoyosella subflava]|uniref:Uncharacterized protein n=1 Tax=Hoyosella subflava (strain DSM 45089 / JCM 17490 / NBRC 109087 / DQS3-9A1) TaxID=443218 RepID=F6EJV0_HOYSD|nr:maltose ABC transporter substrate-binding protein [Hoyosella subflava]AEF40125.1 hypothetical protein AS9A_1676 [Hoyosella subflava DQS3-9A1]
MNRRTRLTTGAAAALATTLLASCASGEGQGEAVQQFLGQSGGPITIWAGEEAIAGLTEIANEYEADTGVPVRIVQRDASPQTMSEFITQSPMGQGPDLLMSPHDNLGQLVANGLLMPIELGDQGEDFLDVAMQAVTYEGAVYGVPFAVENVAVLRNNELTTHTPETFDDLIADGQALVEAGQADFPISIPQDPSLGDPYHLYPLQTSFGAPVFGMDDDGSYTTELAMGGESGEAFAEYLAGLGAAGVLKTSLTPDIGKDAFVSGRAPYIISGPWNLNDFEAADMDLTLMPVPTAGGQTAQPFVGVQAVFMNANSGNALPANDFLVNYLTRLDTQLAIFESVGRPPALNDAIDAIADRPLLSAYAELAEAGAPMPAIPEMRSVWTFWGTTQNGIVEGQGEPALLWRRMIANIEN